jgi:hypothetical protein
MLPLKQNCSVIGFEDVGQTVAVRTPSFNVYTSLRNPLLPDSFVLTATISNSMNCREQKMRDQSRKLKSRFLYRGGGFLLAQISAADSKQETTVAY